MEVKLRASETQGQSHGVPRSHSTLRPVIAGRFSPPDTALIDRKFLHGKAKIVSLYSSVA
jgi:hypothetical protein